MEMPPQWDEARLKCSILGRCYPLDGVRNEARAGDRPRGQFDGANVLIAEDVSCIAWLICEILTEGGYDIVGPAASTRIAAELIAKEARGCCIARRRLDRRAEFFSGRISRSARGPVRIYDRMRTG